jgi:hypothetical protein
LRSSARTSGVLLVGFVLVTVRTSYANSCAGQASIAAALRSADAVFVATIDRVAPRAAKVTHSSDGSTSVSISSGPDDAVLSITDAIKGSQGGRIQVKSDIHLIEKETYLVYAAWTGSVLGVSSCSRTRVRAEAAEDLKFFDGLRQGRPQAVLYGLVVQRRADSPDAVGLYAPVDSYEIVAGRDGREYRSTVSKNGQFQIVLPPGSYLVWIESQGRVVTNAHTIDLRDAEERETMLVSDVPQ